MCDSEINLKNTFVELKITTPTELVSPTKEKRHKPPPAAKEENLDEEQQQQNLESLTSLSSIQNIDSGNCIGELICSPVTTMAATINPGTAATNNNNASNGGGGGGGASGLIAGSILAANNVILTFDDLMHENLLLRDKLKEISSDRDRLLCEVANLRLELDMAELKRLPEERYVPKSKV